MSDETCGSSSSSGQSNISPDFYRKHADQYAEVVHDPEHAVFLDSSHKALLEEVDLLNRLMELIPGQRGLDAGCATARDTHYLWKEKGCDIYGIDAVEENIQAAQKWHSEIADRLSVASLCEPLNFSDESFDFVICNAVIQHITPEDVFTITLREFARVLKPDGVLQLMFKNGHGIQTIRDPAYDVDRSFQLYEADELLAELERHGLKLVDAEDPNVLGGVMYFLDPKPMKHCVFYARKEGR